MLGSDLIRNIDDRKGQGQRVVLKQKSDERKN